MAQRVTSTPVAVTRVMFAMFAAVEVAAEEWGYLVSQCGEESQVAVSADE